MQSLKGRGSVMHPAARTPLRRLLVVPSIALVLVRAACGNGTSSSGNNTGTGPLLLGVIAPFTGADAGLGPAYYAACLPAALTINNNGGAGGRAVASPHPAP